ncbi:MAG TPA: GNAT family N-acyltransferase [Bryobacteraceae bacterium]
MLTPWEAAVRQLPIPAALRPFVIPPKIQRRYEQAASGAPDAFLDSFLKSMDVKPVVSDSDLERIPRQGPLVIVANHPFGLLEGLIVARLLDQVRPDVRILANSVLGFVPEMSPRLILVDPFKAKASVGVNGKGVREALGWLGRGGALLAFPAGEVSHFDIRQRAITDPEWNEKLIRFVRHTQSTVVPMFINGANSLAFQLMGMVNAHLRTARLLHELANKDHQRVEIRVGAPVEWAKLRELGSDADSIRYLRYRTYLLSHRTGAQAAPAVMKHRVPVAEEVPVELIEREVTALGPDQRLGENGGLEIYLAEAGQIPAALAEIGRLREIAFRAEGEGTGHARDLDSYDTYYQHLFLWSRTERRIAGAYRLSSSREVLSSRGIGGLYTSSLFAYRPEFFARLGPAIELGRSFVRPEFQKQYAPLLLLWKGIATVAARRPDHPILFGAVSISNGYQPVSRRLIVRYLEAYQSRTDLAGLVRARKPFRAERRGSDNESISLMLRDAEELSEVTADIEPDRKGIPILLKQYLRLGGKLVGFNVDPRFSDALDGLIMVDLRQTPAAILQRYMGRENATRFVEYHTQSTASDLQPRG